MAFTGEYIKVKEIGTIGSISVELGHYVENGKTFPDKIYMKDHFTKKDGSSSTSTIAKLTIEQFNALKKMEV